jgi:predicted peroxiredoxin
MARRSFLSQLIALPFLGITDWSQDAAHKPLKVMMKSAWGSDDPTKSAFPFLHGLALSEAGHTVQIFLLGKAVSVMRGHRQCEEERQHGTLILTSCNATDAITLVSCKMSLNWRLDSHAR